jgi:DNA polymerase
MTAERPVSRVASAAQTPVAVAHVDFETFSECDLTEAGAYVYAAHPSTEILCMGWAIGEEPVQLWLPGQPFPAALAAHILIGGAILAHNAAFERQVWRSVGRRVHGFPEVDDDQWWCTAAQAANMGLPRDLDGAAGALGGAMQKDRDGHRIMRQVTKPKKATKADPSTRHTPALHPEKFTRLYAYCRQDVAAERGIAGRVYALSPAERATYLLDQRINDRGVKLDLTLARAAQRIVGAELKRLDALMAETTGNRVLACTEVGKLKDWLQDNGLPHINSVAAHVIEDCLQRAAALNMPWKVERALRLRQEAGKSSTAKLDAMLACAGHDDRARGLMLYYGAQRTGRWSGRLVQPQNMPRGTLDERDVDMAIRLILDGDADSLRLIFGSVLAAVSSVLRGCFVAEDGHDLMACDFANIEGRVLAWCAGEAWKTEAFRAYDAGTGPDLYKVAYSRSLGTAVEQVTKPQRQVGKVIELACGYQGWIGAFQTFAKLYGVKVADDEAARLAGAWRDAHPRVVRFWWDCNDAALRAVARPGTKQRVGPVTYLCKHDYLWCRLPSGRVLAYCQPTIEPNDRGEDAVHFWGVPNPLKPWKRGTARWAQMSGYGGLWVENIVQAISRDILTEAMHRCEAAGFPIVLTVHDEIVCEIPQGGPSLDALRDVMGALPAWAGGLPIATDGWAARRYKK